MYNIFVHIYNITLEHNYIMTFNEKKNILLRVVKNFSEAKLWQILWFLKVLSKKLLIAIEKKKQNMGAKTMTVYFFRKAMYLTIHTKVLPNQSFTTHSKIKKREKNIYALLNSQEIQTYKIMLI